MRQNNPIETQQGNYMNSIDHFLANYRQEAENFYVDLIPEIEAMGDCMTPEARHFRAIHGPELYMTVYRMIKDLEETGEPVSLMKMLDRKVEDLKASLIFKISKKAGEIVDTAGLHFGHDGNLNGIVIGTEKTVTVRTILAGGYNIQCLHFRVLVK